MHKIHSIRSLLLAAIMFAIPTASFAQISVGIAVNVAPPELPVYDQPICPGEGYIWTPGYWGYGDDDYYWVPGTWVLAPRVGVLWTPGYWGWGGGGYLWHVGYWGPHVGFYGGVNYGYGYVGEGYLGGRWDRGHFAYNRAVNNVNVTVIHNTYNTRITNNYTNTTRVSYNGGTGGVRAQATARDQQAAREHHIEKTGVQVQHEQAARSDRSQFASVNHGRPNVAATPRPGAFNDRGVVHANAGGGASNARGNGRPANTVNSNNTRANTARTDRPNTATQPNTARGANSTRPNGAQTNNSPRANSDRPANARSVAPRNTPAERGNAHTDAPRNTTQDRPSPQHSNAARPAPSPRPAPQADHAPAQQQHSAPRTESKPQPHERDPHAKP